MEQHLNPPAKGLVLEIGSGDNPNPRADILVDKFLFDNTERHRQGISKAPPKSPNVPSIGRFTVGM